MAHVSEQGFVLLLPTDIYVAAGCFAVVISIVVVSLFPHGWAQSIFKPITLGTDEVQDVRDLPSFGVLTSLVSLLLLIALVVIGVLGTRDPLANLLPLIIWTVWWIPLVMLVCLVGDLWKWINPWTGLHLLIFKRLDQEPLFKLPEFFGIWPALVTFVAFVVFSIAHPAPDDPAILANVVLGYLLFTFAGMVVFGGNSWLHSFECFSFFFRNASMLAPLKVGNRGRSLTVGLAGWRAMNLPRQTINTAIFILVLLASGSFDGVNETFWWLAQIGVNPLEFPGRSAVIFHSITGLLMANILLLTVFALVVWIGAWLARDAEKNSATADFKTLFCNLAVSLIPISFAYHGSHYFISFLVNGQYVVAALSDPLANGSNYLGLENYQVTTGFLNTKDSVQRIWFTQASFIVGGHILAVLMAHCAISKFYPTRRRAFLCHIPIGVFMAAYTWFGLWLLAAPRGA